MCALWTRVSENIGTSYAMILRYNMPRWIKSNRIALLSYCACVQKPDAPQQQNWFADIWYRKRSHIRTNRPDILSTEPNQTWARSIFRPSSAFDMFLFCFGFNRSRQQSEKRQQAGKQAAADTLQIYNQSFRQQYKKNLIWNRENEYVTLNYWIARLCLHNCNEKCTQQLHFL